MVPYEIVEIQRTSMSYKEGYHWAEPDRKSARDYMLRLVEDQQYYQELADKAKVYIEEKLSLSQAADKISRRLNEIYQEHGQGQQPIQDSVK